MQRITTETQLGDRTIPAGQIVTVWLGGANRDETQFEQAEKFVVARPILILLLATGFTLLGCATGSAGRKAGAEGCT